MDDNEEFDTYCFWPTEKVDLLFSKNIDREQFFQEMKKLYEKAFICSHSIRDELNAVISDLPIKKQFELLQTLNRR